MIPHPQETPDVPFLTEASLDHPGLSHGFFTRQGGVSTYLYNSLNTAFSSGDDAKAVSENRQRVCQTLGFSDLVTLKQVHGDQVITVEALFSPDQAPEADALVTKTPGILLGILTADCAPVLFADHKRGIIGAAHAGWGGALAGILPATLRAMQELGANLEDITAVIGPCIQQHSYEVDSVFYQKFLGESAAYQTFFSNGTTPLKFWFDLPGFVRFQLYNAGVSQVEALEHDTYDKSDLFFSYRRSTHEGAADYGRQLSVIGLTTKV